MSIDELRNTIDVIDDELALLFAERMNAVREIKLEKQRSSTPVSDIERERAILSRVSADSEYKTQLLSLFSSIFNISREYQSWNGYGLIGENVSGSFSSLLHAAFGLGGYSQLSLCEDQFNKFIQTRDFKGVNVTMPYKSAAYEYCDCVSSDAQATKTVNTLIKTLNGTIFGDNTDVFGLLYMAKRARIDFKSKKVLILGGGGTSRTAAYASILSGARETLTVSRSGNGDITYDKLDDHRDANIIINTTPVGMFPNNGSALIDVRDFKNCDGVLDTVYNPLRSALILEAESLNIPCSGGLPMLAAQAKKSDELFLNANIPDELIEDALFSLSKRLSNIVLIGMPGCGKTTLGRYLSLMLFREHIDTDELIAEQTGLTAKDIIIKYGESYFRKLEHDVISTVGKKHGAIISTGGGAVLNRSNYAPLAQNGSIFFIERSIDELSAESRPLSFNLNSMYSERLPLYLFFADHTVQNIGSIHQTIQKIKEAFYANTGN